MLKEVLNLLTKDEIELATQYWNIKKHTMDLCNQCPNSKSEYSDILSETFLLSKLPTIEKAFEERLLPTYSFSRLYLNNSELPIHCDRPSCEVSVTINIFMDKEWKIHMRRKDNQKTSSLNTFPGNGIIYEGMKYDHWRDKYEGQECMQIFLHYVRSNGQYKDYHKDKRDNFGMPR